MSQPFVDTPVDEFVSKLTTDEKISLLGAPNWWNTNAVPRLGIPSVRMSDGPNGVRGSSHFLSTPAQCIPCATSMASTFDTELIEKVGAFLAEEAKIKSATVLLAPTVNIQRSPLGGRAFESFSEDSHLSGMMAAAYVQGLQSNGVASTIKHFVANDQEHERTSVDTIVSERALREVYLMPFMIAQRKASPWGYMTAYNRLNGVHCSESPELLDGVLRNEWKFDGLVVSDWYGTYGVDQPINAGMDLEMPGPPKWRTPALIYQCITAGKIKIPALDKRAKSVVSFVQKIAKASPDIVFGDGKERSRDSPEIRNFCRKLAADGMVLLKNHGGVLPIAGSKRVAVIGPNAKARVISGGGSAFLKPTYVVTPSEGLKSNAPQGIVIDYALGCYAHKFLPTLEDKLTTPSGEPGWLCTFYAHDTDGQPTIELATFVLNDTRVKLNDFLPPGLTPEWTIKLRGIMKAETTAPFEFGLTVAGRAKLWVNDKETIDNWTKQRPGEFFYGQGTAEEKATVELQQGETVNILVEYRNTLPPNSGERNTSQPALMKGVRLGGCEKVDADAAIREAVELASVADVAIIVVGLSSEWESEGFDRPSLSLPGRQDELIAAVSKVNPRTVVCIQSGSAVSMPWIDNVAGLVQAWLSGNESGNALADVIFGKVNPAGRLPLTLPAREEDIPAHLNFRSENGKVHYAEGVFVGYKHYQSRKTKPLYPFGFGLSYTTFTLSDLQIVQSGTDSETFSVQVQVSITNTGHRDGSEVVQLYVGLPDLGITHPKMQLKAFSKAFVAIGETKRITLNLDRYAVSFWDEPNACWLAEAGNYRIYVGTSCEDIANESTIKLERSFTWVGL